MPQFKVEGYDEAHFKRTEQYVKLIKNIYHAAIREAVRLGISVKYNPDKPFLFDNFPTIKAKMAKLFEGVSDKMEAVILLGIESEWNKANDKNDAFVESVLKTDKMPERALARLLGRNQEALDQFKIRKSNGLNLSDRVWNQTKQFRSELEMALEVGISEGKSADQISRDIRSYLENPDKLFRRVRDLKTGMLRLSQHAKSYKPGQGVYRSSYKNAQRLSRSEVNMAYRTADSERWQKLDFVVGIEVRRSNNPYPCDICSKLVGKYPKNYLFRSFHPNCRCHAISILASDKEVNELERRMWNDEETSNFKSGNAITKINPGYENWIKDNKERILRAKTIPFFLSDNPTYFKMSKIIG